MKELIKTLKEKALVDMSNEIEFFAGNASNQEGYRLEVGEYTSESELPLYINEEKAGPVNQALAKSRLRGSKDPYLDPGFLEDLLGLIKTQTEMEPLSANHEYSQGKLIVLSDVLKTLGEEDLSAFAEEFAGLTTAEIIEP